MLFLTGIITGVLFMVLQVFPPLGVILPIYKIKKLQFSSVRDHLIVNGIAIAISAIVDYNFTIVYFAFLLPELLYYYINAKYSHLKIFDRINIIALFTTAGFAICYYFIFESAGIGFDELREIYEKNLQLSAKELNSAFAFIKDYSIYLLFIYSIFMVYIIYFYFNFLTFFYWEISYLWILPYLILFLGKHLDLFQGVYVENALKIVQVMFIPYGVKAIYLTLLRRFNRRFLCKFITVFILAYSPYVTFVYGVLSSLKSDKPIKK